VDNQTLLAAAREVLAIEAEDLQAARERLDGDFLTATD